MARSPVPNGVIAYLTVADGNGASAFYQRAFGATELFRQPAGDGKRLLHCQIEINGGLLMLSDHFPDMGSTTLPPGEPQPPVTLHIQVDDVDAVFARAIDAGARELMAPTDMFWGDRYARLRDPYGHVWSVGGAPKR